MNNRLKTGLFVAAGFAILMAVFYAGYTFGCSTQPAIIVRPESREIVSNMHASVTDSTSSTFSGSTHSNYSTDAFSIVGMELPEILESIAGENAGQYFAYVLPDGGGFHLVIHHDNDIPNLTDEQHKELIDRVNRRLDANTTKL